ncbi:MAG: hypothetical protein GY856_32030, partial [bacterium]|nr:hypothetical protein [bacterium]
IDAAGRVKVPDNYHVQEYFDANPVCVAKAGAGAATGTAGDENLMQCNNSLWEYHMLGTQTIVGPTLGTYGVNAILDDAEDDGVEFCLGISALNKGVFVVGTAPAFFARMRFSIDDVSGTDDCAFGFRKVEAYQANIDGYADWAALNVISGNINIETEVGGGGTTTTDTTNDWADGAIHELEVRVSAAGVVTYKIDGVDPLVTAAFTFTDATVLVPFFYVLCAADPEAADVSMIEFE